MKQRRQALQLTHSGGPAGWPGLGTGVSWDDAIRALSHRSGDPVYFLAIDQATRSGWAVRTTRRIVLHGSAITTDQKVSALEQLRQLERFSWQNVLVVFEDHRNCGRADRARYSSDGRPTRHKDDTEPLALGAARGAWSTLLDLRNHPKTQRLFAAPHEWRVVLKGLKFSEGDDWKSAALRWAALVAGVSLDDDNEAEAMVMSEWAALTGLHRWASARLRDNAEQRQR